MSVIEEKARLIAAKASGAPEDAVGLNAADVVAMLPTIIALIKDVMALFKGKGATPATVAGAMKKPGLVARLGLRRIINKRVPADKREAAFQAALAVGKTITADDVTKMLAEV